MLHAYRKRFINVRNLYKSSVTFEDKTEISNFKIQIKAHNTAGEHQGQYNEYNDN